MSIDLPDAVATYFAIGNRRDPSLVPACFAADAHVRDERHDYHGLAAIRDWLTAAQQKYEYRAEPVSVSRSGTAVQVVATVTGNFPGSPARLTYVFGLANDRIVSLEIS